MLIRKKRPNTVYICGRIITHSMPGLFYNNQTGEHMTVAEFNEEQAHSPGLRHIEYKGVELGWVMHAVPGMLGLPRFRDEISGVNYHKSFSYTVACEKTRENLRIECHIQPHGRGAKVTVIFHQILPALRGWFEKSRDWHKRHFPENLKTRRFHVHATMPIPMAIKSKSMRLVSRV